MDAAPPAALGLIAGRGSFPLEIARSARERGLRVAAVAFHGQTDPRLGREAHQVTWLHPGEIDAAADALLGAGARDAVMVGKVPKTTLYGDRGDLRADARAVQLMDRLKDRSDASILGTVAEFLASRGIRLLAQTQLVPQLLAEDGPMGATRPTPEQLADVRFGFPIAKTLAELDVGQTIVVKNRAVLAVEAIEGTDEAIRRGGSIGAGACVVKVAKPNQDPRFDVPTIGVDTVAVLAEAGAALLAFEAGQTVVLDRELLVERADAHGIALIGVRGGEGDGAVGA